jgi:hypothetical protein
MDLRELLRKIETAPNSSLELDSEFASVFPSAPRKVTPSIDAAGRLIESELPGWWWTCGYVRSVTMPLSMSPAPTNFHTLPP